MERIEPTIGDLDLSADPRASARKRKAQALRRQYQSLLGWLSVLFVILALIVGSFINLSNRRTLNGKVNEVHYI